MALATVVVTREGEVQYVEYVRFCGSRVECVGFTRNPSEASKYTLEQGRQVRQFLNRRK